MARGDDDRVVGATVYDPSRVRASRPRPAPPRAGAGRRVWNFEGAFPLLLIGGALLVYAAILANQEMPLSAHHLPFYALVGGVGAVVAGAGVFSTFLPPEPEEAPTIIPDDWVVISRSEWEESRAPRRIATPPPSLPERSSDQPPWWEGAPSPSVPAPAPPRATPPPDAPSVRRSTPAPPPRPPARVASSPAQAPVTPAPSRARPPSPPASRTAPSTPTQARLEAYRQEFPQEFLQALSELEEIAHRELDRAPPTPAPSPEPGDDRCVDCERKLPANDPSPNLCESCGRGLCIDCALSSQREDGDLKCIECRVRPDATPDPTIDPRSRGRPGVR